jgi:hypothetical protein
MGWGLLSLSVAGLNTFVLAAGILREQPAFWTNAGGYPLWARAAVKFGFYPAFAVLLLLAVGRTRVAFGQLEKGEAVGRWLVSLAAIEWILFGGVAGMTLVDNLQKWWNG